MNCKCLWNQDRNNIFIQHILQLISISECNVSCQCLLCQIIKNLDCKCNCGNFHHEIKNCTSCTKKICSDCSPKDSLCNKCVEKSYSK